MLSLSIHLFSSFLLFIQQVFCGYSLSFLLYVTLSPSLHFLLLISLHLSILVLLLLSDLIGPLLFHFFLGFVGSWCLLILLHLHTLFCIFLSGLCILSFLISLFSNINKLKYINILNIYIYIFINIHKTSVMETYR